jgi:hypothetical protein
MGLVPRRAQSPPFSRRRGCALNKKIPFLSGADGVVSKRSRSLLFSWTSLGTSLGTGHSGARILPINVCFKLKHSSDLSLSMVTLRTWRRRSVRRRG